MRRIALLLLTVAALPFITSRPAAALPHLKLLRSSPAADTTLATSPDAIRLWLSEPPEAATSKITLALAGGAAVPVGKPTLGAAKDAPLEARITAPLAPGRYTVTWKAMSKDGHVVDGTFGFTVGR